MVSSLEHHFNRLIGESQAWMGDILLEVIPSNYPSGDSHKASFVAMNGVCAMQNKCMSSVHLKTAQILVICTRLKTCRQVDSF